MAYIDKYGVEFSDDRKTLVRCPVNFCGDYVIPNNILNIGNGAFGGCNSMTSVSIPNGIKSIGEKAFFNCNSLQSVVVPDSVVCIGNSVFEKCGLLASVIIPNGITSIGDCAFKGCVSLISIKIPDSVSRIGEKAFYGCWCLTSVTIGNSVTRIGKEAFTECCRLKSITIPDGVISIEERTFYGCWELTAVAIGKNVSCIGERAFYDCHNLIAITIPNSVTSIGEGAFSECSSLTSVTIPNSVTSIGNYAFLGCSELKDIFVPLGQEERFSEKDGLKDFADEIRRTSEQRMASGEFKRTWEECLQDWSDYLNRIRDSSNPLNKSILSSIENGLEPSVFPPVGICLTVDEYNYFFFFLRDIKEIYGWCESGKKIHDCVRLSTKYGQRIGPDTPRKGFYKVVDVNSDEVKCLYNYRRYTTFYDEIITIKLHPFYNNVSEGPKAVQLMVDDIIEVKDVLLVDSVYDGKRDKAYKVIWDFVERAERFIPEHDGYSLSYSQYGGYNDFDDDTINSAFEGDPEMTWNVD